MGVINAHEIVQARLNALKWEAKLAEEGLNAATWAEIEAHLKAADTPLQRPDHKALLGTCRVFHPPLPQLRLELFQDRQFFLHGQR